MVPALVLSSGVAAAAGSLSISPSINLTNGQSVQVSGSSPSAGVYQLLECLDGNVCDTSKQVTVTTGADGSFGPMSFTVQQQINVGSPSAPEPVECGAGSDQCYIKLLQGGLLLGIFQPISFGSLSISPSATNLTNGRTVEVSGSGLPPGVGYQLFECLDGNACDTLTGVTVNTATGSFGPIPFTVQQPINVGSSSAPELVECGTGSDQCYIKLLQNDGLLGIFQPISFGIDLSPTGSPYIAAAPGPGMGAYDDDVDGGGAWPNGETVTLQIVDQANGPVAYTATTVVQTGGVGPSDFDFYLGGTFDLQAGQIVTVSDVPGGGSTTETTTVTALTETLVDPGTDTVTGTAAPGSSVTVLVFNTEASRDVTADASGNWSANFAVSGNPPDDVTYNITGGTAVGAMQFDGAGNLTATALYPPMGMTVSQTDGLSDGQMVSVSGSGLTPGLPYVLEQCVQYPFAGFCDTSDTSYPGGTYPVPLTLDAKGNFGPTDFVVRENINVTTPVIGADGEITGYTTSPVDCSQEACDVDVIGGPQNGTSPPMAYISFATPTCGGLLNCRSASSPNSSGSVTATSPGMSGLITASATGGGVITVGRYPADPVNPPTFLAAAGYFDVGVSSSNSFTSVTVVNCDLQGGTSAQWWNPASGATGAWQPVSNQSYSPGPPACLTITVNATTSPSLAQLTGTVFAVGVLVGTSPITVTVAGSQTFGSFSLTFTPTYTAPSGVSVTGTVACATVNGGTPVGPTLSSAGAYTIDGSSCSGLSASLGYSVTYAGGSFTVNQATPSITWSSPAPITYGTALGPAQLDAAANVPGTFTYSPPAGTVLGIGVGQTLSATFAPSDGADYTTASASTRLNVMAPPGWTTAVVVDSNGEPLVGVPIGFRSAAGNVTTLTTGSDGTASTALTPGKYTVTATYANGTQSQALTVTASGPNTVTFSTVAVTVQVNDPSSSDIATATVAHAGNTGSFGPKTAVNSSGQVTFQALPGTSSFTAWVAGGYQTQSLNVTASGPNTVTFSTVAVTVQVNDPSSLDIAAASVAHAGNTGSFGPKTMVNASGQVIFQALPGTSSFTAWVAGGYQTQSLNVTASGPNAVTFSTVAVTVQVNDPSSSDIATASVAHAGNTGSFGPKTPVNSSGQVTFQALPGTSSFTAWVAGGYQTQSLNVTASGPKTVSFATYAVTVTVLKKGSPLATAAVAHAGNTGTYGSKVPVNASGQVTFQALPGTSCFTAWDGNSYSSIQLTVTGAISTSISVS
jgi:hypothetical protein